MMLGIYREQFGIEIFEQKTCRSCPTGIAGILGEQSELSNDECGSSEMEGFIVDHITKYEETVGCPFYTSWLSPCLITTNTRRLFRDRLKQ